LGTDIKAKTTGPTNAPAPVPTTGTATAQATRPAQKSN
jgi:hypothetical protein